MLVVLCAYFLLIISDLMFKCHFLVVLSHASQQITSHRIPQFYGTISLFFLVFPCFSLFLFPLFFNRQQPDHLELRLKITAFVEIGNFCSRFALLIFLLLFIYCFPFLFLNIDSIQNFNVPCSFFLDSLSLKCWKAIYCLCN